ncbi:MAG: sigma-70 family RNA polymerase sigma factor [Ruminococcaceae bacterium]|nr:sigma-70 family RNA polymerase sigma factor [Oscillospiraceae bacterium]
MRLSLDEAFQKFADRVFSAAFSVCRNRADADDTVQDTFLKYHTLNMDYESEEHIRAWLIRVAVNRAKDISSSFWHKNRVAWEDYMDELPFETPEDRGLFEAVMRLPDKYRVVIHLFYYEDYSVGEIAGILHSREGTVKSQLNRGRMLLKNMLKEEWDDDE